VPARRLPSSARRIDRRSEEEWSAETAYARGPLHAHGIPSVFLGLDELKRRVPIINTDGILSALWEDEKGYVDPASATQAFAIAARNFGASIRRHSPVTATRKLSSGEWEVRRPAARSGRNTSSTQPGFGRARWPRWPASACRYARGAPLPVTETIPEVAAYEGELPTVSDNAWNWYCRREGQGLLLGAYETPCRHWAENGTPSTSATSFCRMTCPAWRRILLKAVEVLPCLGTAGVKAGHQRPDDFFA
jgi:dimethylglycine dehydrogenase